MNKHDVIIVGSGISGLSLAHFCAKEGLKTLVLEKAERIGGTFHSHRLEGEGETAFRMELGAHTCYNSYGNLIGIIEDCGIQSELVAREKVPFRMLVEGKIKSIPSQLNFLNLFANLPKIFSAKKTGASVESYYSKVMGKSNFDNVLQHMFNAVVCQKANDFPADLLFKKRSRRKDVLKSFTLRGGIQTITDAIAANPNIEILSGQEIQSIQYDHGNFQVSTKDDGGGYVSRFLALATPPPTTARLLPNPFREVSNRLSKLRATNVESLGVIVLKDSLLLEPVAGIVSANDSFYSVVSADTVKHDTYRGFTFHFKPNTLDYESKLARISEVLGVPQDQFIHIAQKENTIPTLGQGHHKLVKEIDDLLAGNPLFLTGNYFNGMAIEDCVSRSQTESSRMKKLLTTAN